MVKAIDRTNLKYEKKNKITYVLSEYTDVKDKKFISNPGCYATAT